MASGIIRITERIIPPGNIPSAENNTLAGSILATGNIFTVEYSIFFQAGNTSLTKNNLPTENSFSAEDNVRAENIISVENRENFL